MSVPTEHPISSFVIRFISEVDGSEIRWRGRIRSVQSDNEVGFISLRQAAAFMYQQLADDASAQSPGLARMFEGIEVTE